MRKNIGTKRRRFRNAVRRGHLGYVGKSSSLKIVGDIGDRMVQWESRLERDAVRLLEFSTSIKEIRFQFEKIMLGDLGYCVPDFHAYGEYGVVTVLEVKPAAKLSQPDVQERLKATRSVVTSRGQSYVVLTEQQVRCKPLADNLVMLSTYRRPYVDSAFLERNLAKLLPLLPLAVREAKRHLEVPGTLETLLAFQLVEFDYRAPFTEQTLLHCSLDANRFLF